VKKVKSVKKRTQPVDDWRVLRTPQGRTLVAFPVYVVVLFSLLLIGLFLTIWSLNRHHHVRMHVGQSIPLQLLLPSMVGLTHGAMEEGNQVELLENGAFFDAMLADVAAAKSTVHFETFLWHKSAIGRRVATMLAQKARSGVEVRVSLDASGTRPMEKELVRMMESAGCKVQRYHPFSLGYLGRVNNRDHRKIVVVDGLIGYIGGHGISDEWTGKAQDHNHYRDTALRVTGPIVNRIQAAFCENWIEETGELLAGPRYFPLSHPTGSTPVHLAYVSASNNPSDVALLYILAIESAKESIVIENPYFLPGTDALDALRRAVQRGVDVRVMLPSTEATDNAIVQHASHHHFGTLLKAGIHVYEYKKTLLHPKTIVVDHLWSSVGSTNFDDRSFELNDEISMGVVDAGLAAQLEKAFNDDLRYAEERKFSEWKDRPLWHKALDGAAYLINHQL
jgi:cardiolipin synthase